MTDFGRRSGVGDMLKSVYDVAESGVVDDTEGIKGKTVDDTDIGDQKVLAYDDASGKIKYITPAPSGATINSIQWFECIIGIGNSSNTQTITEVDVDKTMLLHTGSGPDATGFNRSLTTIELTNSTTVTVRSGQTTVQTVEVGFMVVEFTGGIDRIQRGSITMSGSSKDTTISEVDLAYTILNILGMRSSSNSSAWTILQNKFHDSTTIRTQYGDVSADAVISYEVIEFSAPS